MTADYVKQFSDQIRKDNSSRVLFLDEKGPVSALIQATAK